MDDTEGKTGRSGLGGVYLFVAAIIWGLTFSAQSAAMDDIGPLTFYAMRSFLGVIVTLPFAFIYGRVTRKGLPEQSREEKKAAFARLWKVGLCCGLVMAASALLQQYGIVYTTVGKASFITTLYIVFVPLLWGLLGRKVALPVWVGVGIAAIGLYLLCMNGGFYIQLGDLLILGCGLLFAVHILIVDKYCNNVNPVALSAVQFIFAGAVSLVGMFIFEKPTLEAIWAARIPIFYAGVMSSGIAFTFQIIGQKRINPTVAALIMSLESVFGALGGWLILGQKMSGREIAGGALVFVAVILAQLPPSLFKRGARDIPQKAK